MQTSTLSVSVLLKAVVRRCVSLEPLVHPLLHSLRKQLRLLRKSKYWRIYQYCACIGGLRGVSNIKVLRFIIMIPVLTTLSVIASWYGPGFNGNLPANGERFNQNALTTAHKTLPFGTRLRVCFKRCAVVRVNDRGPYINGRKLDLSKGAADAIGLTGSGVGQVKVTRLN
jgi:3D (Asp-Asp-Asp) domain-containing protein